jgi:AcrR family transcriptional regulator
VSAEALSRERILSATLALIDRDGVAAFGLRGLAQQLGVYPTAIYWHVPNRDALIAGAVELALRGVGSRLPRGPWPQRLRVLLRRFRTALRRHPKLAPVVGSELLSNGALDLLMLDHIVAALEEAGFDGIALVDAFNVVIAAMCGFVTLELATAPLQAGRAWAEAHRARVDALSTAGHPALARHLPRLRGNAFILRWENGTDQPLNRSFDAWLDVVLDGLALRAVAQPSRTAV